MSAPIQTKIIHALKAFALTKKVEDLGYKPDENKSNFENLALFQAAHEVAMDQIKIMQTMLDDISTALNQFTDLTRKLGANSDPENELFAAFTKKSKIDESVAAAYEKLARVQEVEHDLTAQIKIYTSKVQREERAEQLAHAQAMAATIPAGAAPAQAPAAQPSFGTLYALPTLHIRPFKGDRRTWPEFYESFRNAANSRSGTAADKLNLLRSLLEGEPKALISGFRLEDKNYTAAMDLLRDTYGDEKSYVRTLHAELSNLPRADNLSRTHSLLLELERITRELRTMGEDVESPMVHLSLEKKLNPAFLRTILIKKAESPDDWNTTKFLQTLNDAVRRESNIREVMDEYGHQQKGANKRPQQSSNPRRSGPGIQPKGREHTFINASVDAPPTNKPRGKGKPKGTRQISAPNPKPSQSPATQPTMPCVFCGQLHWQDKCQRFSTVSQRKEVLRSKNLCFKCMRGGHSSRECPRPSRCFKCKQAHPTPLCPNSSIQSVDSIVQQDATAQEPKHCACAQSQEQLINANSQRERADLLSSAAITGKKALLMTTEATIFNVANPHKSMVASIFMDPGSHRSFISAKVAEHLQLHAHEQEKCLLSSFGDPQPRYYLSDRVKLGLLCHDGDKMIISLNKMQFIVNQMPIVDLSNINEEQLRKKKLALPEKVQQPDILLGIDPCNALQIHALEKLPSGFILSQTRLGKIISGTGRTRSAWPTQLQPQITFCGAAFSDNEPPDPSDHDPEWEGDSDSDVSHSYKPQTRPFQRGPPIEAGTMHHGRPLFVSRRPEPCINHQSPHPCQICAQEENQEGACIPPLTSESDSDSDESQPPIRRPTPGYHFLSTFQGQQNRRNPREPPSYSDSSSDSSEDERPSKPKPSYQLRCKLPSKSPSITDSPDSSDSEDDQPGKLNPFLAHLRQFQVDQIDTVASTQQATRPPNNPAQGANSTESADQTQLITEAELALNDRMAQYFSLQAIGLDDATDQPDQDEVMRNFQRNLTFIDGRYQVALPWNHRVADLPTNYRQARARLQGTLRKVRKLNLTDQYHAIITDQLEKGVIERVMDPKKVVGPVHYLPHRVVIREDKATTKIRITMDASAKPASIPGAPSLNDCLHTGPLLLTDLIGILLRFRQMERVLLADIEKAFLQLGVRLQDRDATRFLWLDDPFNADLDRPETWSIIIYRFCRVSFGLTVSPFLLNATVREHLSLSDSDVAQRIQKNLYVDNIMVEVKPKEKMNALANEIQQLFNTGGMKLQEFFSSEPVQLTSAEPPLPEGWLAKDMQQTKVLGIKWIPTSNELEFQFPQFTGPFTKRQVLSIIAQIYDPLGLLSPCLLMAKQFLRTLHEANLQWDQELPAESQDTWKDILQSWEHKGQSVILSFPRYICTAEHVEYHCFVDASGIGLGVAVYQRSRVDPHMRVNFSPQYECNLIFAKALLKPSTLSKKEGSTPKMELQSLALGAKIIKYIQKQLNVTNNSTITLWTDSQCSIDWLKRVKKYERFIDNRLKVIRECFVDVKHVDGTQNPADRASRGLTPALLSVSRLWKHGPEWLSWSESRWPEPKAIYYTGSEIYEDQEAEATFEMTNPVTEVITHQSVIDSTRFSQWRRLKASTVYFFRFIRQISSASSAKFVAPIFKHIAKTMQWTEILTAKELKLAERFLIVQAQNEWPPTESQKRDLRLYLDGPPGLGLWRCAGRLNEANISQSAKNPILLPPKAWITKLLIMDSHRKNNHVLGKIHLGILRQKYWIPQGRRTIEQLVYSPTIGCFECRRSRAAPYTVPEAPDLPKERVAEIRPFAYTGVDYFGPMKAKTADGTIKVYVALFTCLTIRAIHLEVADDYSVAAFLQTFRRFVSRRGIPITMFSDNGTNFVLGSKVIQDRWRNVLSTKEVQQSIALRGINWKWTTPHAPWKGGAWERMVGITKNALKRTIGRALLTQTELSTLLCEIEAVINSRPLTFQSEKEPMQALRPIDFLLPAGAQDVELGPPGFDEDPNDPDFNPQQDGRSKLITQFNKSLGRINKFRQIWRDEYLLSLRERDRSKPTSGQSPRIGDVVLIEDDSAPRSLWELGIITHGPTTKAHAQHASKNMGEYLRGP